MHIPDGYLSPVTCATLGAAMVPVWVRASRKVREVVKSRSVPLLAVAAAFCFLVMMFNVPIPDGTTAHAVGAVLVAVLLGPWAAVIAVTCSLLIQALFFGDGGVLALGANTFNMAFVMPFVGYGVYRLCAGRSPVTSRRRALAAGLGGYAGLNAAALCAAIELGLQPALFHTAGGAPLYSPFHLSQTIPAMALAHLTVAGAVEFAVTGAVVAYLQRANVSMLMLNRPALPPQAPAAVEAPPRRGWRWAWIGLGTLAVATPFGLLAPGGAFGEAAPANLDLRRWGLAAVPAGLAHWSRFWSYAALGGYGFRDGSHPVLGYLLSAAVGVAAVGGVILAAYATVRLVQHRRPQLSKDADPV